MKFVKFLIILIVNMLQKLLKNITGIVKVKMVFIVRTDLKMNQGKIASQCSHAAISLYDAAAKVKNTKLLKFWLMTGQPKIVLRIDHDCEHKMQKLYEEAKSKKLNACLVRDAGKTQLRPGSLTVLGIGPNFSSDIDKLTSKLKLL